MEYEARDYMQDPLSAAEIRVVLKALKLKARDVLRSRDPAFKQHDLTGDESDAVLVPLMAANPGLLQRPIGVRGAKAVVGRPIENLLDV